MRGHAGLLSAVAFSALLSLGPASQLLAANAPAASGGWSFQHSDLKPDPDIVFGTLPNGVRYAIRRSQNPPGQVAMRLVIAAGSENEAPGQEGLAHFLEHMAFRGSATVPDGEMVKMLQRLGLQFGADTNAGTGADSTVYMFNLAKSDNDSVDTGLMLLRQIASELTLSQSAMDSERNVILAEENTRAGPALEAQKEVFKAEIGDHPYGRPPIGYDTVIRTAPVSQIRAFYDAYYRPERASVVIAGDIDPAAIQRKIEANFSDWKGRGAPGGDPGPAKIAAATAPRAQEIIKTGLADNQLQIEWLRPWTPRTNTKAEAIDDIVDQVAIAAVRTRLRDLAQSRGLFSISNGLAQEDVHNLFKETQTDGFSVTDVPATIDFLVKSRKQALQYGLTQAEVDFSVNAMIAGLQRAASNGGFVAPTTLVYAAQMTGAALYNSVLQSPAQQLALAQEATQGMTAERVNAALRKLYGDDNPLILYIGPTAPAGGEAGMLAAYRQATAAQVAAYTPPSIKAWPYTDFGPAGRVVDRKDYADIGVTFVTFANGVTLTVKTLPANKDRIDMQVRFGHGRIGMPKDRIDSSDMATTLLNMGGLKDLTTIERNRVLAGRSATALFQETDDAYVISNGLSGLGGTNREDLDLQLQLMAAAVTDPGWRSDEWKTDMAGADQAENAAVDSANGVFSKDGQAWLHPGDMRFVINTKAERDKMTPEATRAFIEPILRDSKLDVLMVGDITPDEAIAAVAKTLGALPPRPGVPEPAGARQVSLPAATPTPIVQYHDGRPDDARALVTWPASDLFANLHDSATLRVLGAIVNQRALDKLRNAEGKTYSPSVGADQSAVYPGWGRIAAGVTAPPAEMDNMFAGLDAIAADLAANPVSADELDRIKTPLVQTVTRNAQQSTFWLTWLAGAQDDPRRLDYVRNFAADLQAVTAADIQAGAQKWLVKDKSWRTEIIPRPKPS